MERMIEYFLPEELIERIKGYNIDLDAFTVDAVREKLVRLEAEKARARPAPI
jgi:predicted nucleotidyltransferase